MHESSCPTTIYCISTSRVIASSSTRHIQFTFSTRVSYRKAHDTVAGNDTKLVTTRQLHGSSSPRRQVDY